jgi:quinoprotein glucose dehydrogenase
VTAGGLVFIAATKDEQIRAFDRASGREVWSAQLPAGGYATPATYQVAGKQYVVIACGGGKMGTRSGDAYVAFALP